jgi:hypothetical protein
MRVKFSVHTPINDILANLMEAERAARDNV